MTAGLAGPARSAEYLANRDSASLPDRLNAFARLVQIGSARSRADGFSTELLKESEALLARVGQRLRLSADHTVAVLAGGTGSGKSSLFNMLAGADFSPVGMVRPVTRTPHACVWGMAGAGPLLDWIGVEDRNRYARSSALDDGERSLSGLLLLDLPDHDSVLAEPFHGVQRLVSLADLMVWVLDPQKYADAAVHSRYLVPMAGHSAVIAVVLNQVDRLSSDQVNDCVEDLQRLLDAEGLHDTRVVVTSALTGAGVEDLRRLLTEAVIARESMAERIRADVDALAARFTPYAGEFDSGTADQAGVAAPQAGETALTDAFAQAAGIAAICRTVQSVRELRAADYVGWPVSWLAERVVRRDPIRKIRLGTLWDELRGVSAAPTDAQAAEIDNAITAAGDTIASGLPAPWSATVRAAARARIDDIPGELGAAVAEALPAENSVTPWWRLGAAWQGLLLGGAVAGIAWVAALLVVGVFHLVSGAPAAFTRPGLLTWAGALAVGCGLLGWLSSLLLMLIAVRSTNGERERCEQQMREAVAQVVRELVLMPAQQEVAEFSRFREALAIARGAL